jgi:hypothetical protein
MVNNIIDGISIKLNQVFGNGYRIYSEKISQGLKEPCFFIAVLNPSETSLLGNRYFRQNHFDVHYFPEDPNDNNDMQTKASSLYEDLEYVTLANGDMVRGTNMRHETMDGILHFFVDYNMHILKPVTAEDSMETLTVDTNTKG